LEKYLEINWDAKFMKLIDDDNRWWNPSLVNDIFNEDEAERIRSLAINPIWIGTSNGEFSVKSAYMHLHV
jgi:hypothetical protein